MIWGAAPCPAKTFLARKVLESKEPWMAEASGFGGQKKNTRQVERYGVKWAAEKGSDTPSIRQTYNAPPCSRRQFSKSYLKNQGKDGKSFLSASEPFSACMLLPKVITHRILFSKRASIMSLTYYHII
jgi:hypothetical protein